MRLYVASAFSNKPEVHEVQAAVINAGHTISHDWTTEDASHLPAGSPEFYAYLEECGVRDFVGVLSADAVIVIAHPDMGDTKAELGIALGLGMPVFVLYPERKHCVFYGYTKRVNSIPELLASL